MASIRIKTNEYNVGALSGKYALKDMSNTGKFSNIIEVNPVKTNFDIDKASGTITLKQGSTLTVPYGFSEVDGKTPVIHYERISKDMSYNVGHVINDYTKESTTDAKVYLVYNYDADELECNANIEYQFIDKDVYEDGVLKYSGNTFIRVDFKSKCALPLGYFDDAWHWHPFTALGFYKDRMWVDSGLVYYVPRGRKEDYGLEVDVINIDSVVYTTVGELTAGTSISSTNASGLLLLDLYGKATMTNKYQSSVSPTAFDGYEYVSSENYIYNRRQETVRLCKVCDVELKNDKFNYLGNYNTYQTVDFAEVTGRISDLDMKMLHNDGREETVTGEFAFPLKANFNNIHVTGGDISAANVTGTLAVANNGKITMDDADIKAVKKKATTPNCIAIVGKGNTARGGIVFGENNTMQILADETAKTFTFNLPAEAAILPTLNTSYDLGSAGQKFKNVYANYYYGKAQSSEWADLAEIYQTDKDYPAGTLLQFGGTKELTIAHDEVNAVVSERPGVLMNADAEGQPVALAGRVRVLVEGPVKKFQKIYLSHRDGIGTTVGYLEETPIGRALEDKDDKDDGLVLCAVHFNI